MYVILLENIKNIGTIGSKVKVKNGFARNYLLPNKKVLRANEKNIQLYKQKEDEYIKISENKKTLALSQWEQLSSKPIVVIKKASNDGILYASVNTKEILSILKKEGYATTISSIRIAEKIKNIGIHTIKVYLTESVVKTTEIFIAKTNDEAIKMIEKHNKEKK